MTEGDKPAQASRTPRAVARGTAVAERGKLWIENQSPDSRKGATIGWFRRYQAADGQLFALLISAYFFVTVLPVMLVAGSYLYSDPQRARRPRRARVCTSMARRRRCSRP